MLRNIYLFEVIIVSMTALTFAHTSSHQNLVGNLSNYKDDLTENGVELNFGFTGIYQQNVHGGISTHRKSGRNSGSYDIELTTDLDRFLGIQNAFFYIHGQGSYSKHGGINDTSVGSYFGTNADGAPRRSFDLTEAWYEQLFGTGSRIRVGKLDITGGFECHGCPVSFDGNTYANDETSQFLNPALVNNPSIPFPDYGLGIVLFHSPSDGWYASAGMVDAQADARETGFNTAFNGEHDYFYVFEAGFTPQFNSANGSLQGAYRFGLWLDSQDKTSFDSGKKTRSDTGFYVSCDQVIVKENSNPDDFQGFAVFGRYGFADGDRNEIEHFFSAGCQYQGLIQDRDQDVIALGLAHGSFSDKAHIAQDHETVCELYYNTVITKSLSIAPSLQYVINPAADAKISDSLIIGMRVQMTF